MRDSCAVFPKRLRRYAPIFLDILGDYYLSQHWDEYYSHSRSTLSQQCYQACDVNAQYLSAEKSVQMSRFLGYMRDTDLLASYHDWHHIERAIRSVMRRLNKLSLQDHAITAVYDLRDSGGSLTYTLARCDMHFSIGHRLSRLQSMAQSNSQ